MSAPKNPRGSSPAVLSEAAGIAAFCLAQALFWHFASSRQLSRREALALLDRCDEGLGAIERRTIGPSIETAHQLLAGIREAVPQAPKRCARKAA
jgi:hypothetical protein